MSFVFLSFDFNFFLNNSILISLDNLLCGQISNFGNCTWTRNRIRTYVHQSQRQGTRFQSRCQCCPTYIPSLVEFKVTVSGWIYHFSPNFLYQSTVTFNPSPNDVFCVQPRFLSFVASTAYLRSLNGRSCVCWTYFEKSASGTPKCLRSSAQSVKLLISS